MVKIKVFIDGLCVIFWGNVFLEKLKKKFKFKFEEFNDFDFWFLFLWRKYWFFMVGFVLISVKYFLDMFMKVSGWYWLVYY